MGKKSMPIMTDVLYALPSLYQPSKINIHQLFLFRQEILLTPTSIAFNSLFVFFIRSVIWSMQNPFLKTERSVNAASKIMRVAAMQKITTSSVMDVIRFRNSCQRRWRTHALLFRQTNFMNRLLSSERSKWIFVIGLVAIGAGFTAKNVISYTTECNTL